MQHRRSAFASALVGAVLAPTLLLPSATPVASASGPAATAGVSAVERAAAKPQPTRFSLSPGVTFNNPTGGRDSRRAILDRILAAIRHARNGSTIQIMTWNYLTDEATNALLAAQKRGAVVRVLIDQANANDETPNPPFNRLRRELRANNGSKPYAQRSAAKTCQNSCRGRGGAAHSKYYLFSHTGSSRRVVMQGSANLTAAMANNQWNEIFTYVDRPIIWDFMQDRFDEAWKDTPVKRAFSQVQDGGYGIYMSPNYGPDWVSDPIIDALDQVRCRGAVDAGNANGRTIIRTSPDVIRGKRGMTAARQLRALWEQGCDVHIVYTVMGGDVRRYLRNPSGRGAVPMKHLVQDFNDDGEFDNYFHLKVWTINGRMGSNRTAYLAFNGSANTSDLATNSDEITGIFTTRYRVLRYQGFIDYWFDNPPAGYDATGTGSSTTGGAAGRTASPWTQRMVQLGLIDPYAHVDLD